MDISQDCMPQNTFGNKVVSDKRLEKMWTKEEHETLVREYHNGIEHCVALIPTRTRGAICNRATNFGLKVDLEHRKYSRGDRRRFLGNKLPPSTTQEGDHSTGAARRLVALLTDQLNAQSKRWGFSVGERYIVKYRKDE